uniref:Reverse transcriptase Ty1/copia-type domain-containing protein n=1 Tax=Nicotiana tabacum TaxID=4097 RepID=A0A1S4CQ16_TOBAC|nr:PREDICTED: uncharacterized protein LOC107821414 [Nicotiana tabacum]
MRSLTVDIRESDASSSTTYTPDPSSPLFLLSSDVPGVSLVRVPFSGTSFGGWRQNMILRVFSTRILLRVFRLSLIEDMVQLVGIKVFDIKQEITSTHQGPFDIASYFNKLKKLWDELRFMCTNHANTYVCAAKPGLQKEGDSASFHVNLNTKSAPPRQFAQKISFDQNKSPLLCKYCKKPGHLIDKCYKLHGFPPNFKFTKGKRTPANVEVQSSICASKSGPIPTESPADSNSVIPGLSKDQYAQLLMLLQQHHISESLPQSSLMASANFAGIVPSPDCVGKAPLMKRPLEIGKQDHGLYKLVQPCPQSDSSVLAAIWSKSNAFPLIKAFVAMVKTQFQTCIQTVRSDNALELGSGALVGQFFVDNGIVHQTSCPHTPQQNGSDPVSSSTHIASPSSSPIPSPVFVPHSSPLLEPPPAPPIAPNLSPAPVRRSSRNHVTPSHLQQYVCSLPPSLYSSSSSPFCSQSLVSISGLEPHSYHQETSIPAWQEAMRKEFEALDANDTWNWSMFQLDVNNAFFHGDLDEEVYMKLPLVCLLRVLLHLFKIKDLGVLNYFLGIEVAYLPSGLLLHQSKFIRDLLHEYNCDMVSPVTCPLDLNSKLKAAMGDLLPSPDTYRSLVGKLNFFIHTRPDLCVAVQHLSQFLQAPCTSHMKAALHLLRYLKGTSDVGVFYGNSPSLSLSAFCDSDWDACPDTCRSAKKQPVISVSSAEAEYRARSKVVAELNWVVRLLSDFGVAISSVVPVFVITKRPFILRRTLFFMSGRSTLNWTAILFGINLVMA